MSPAQSIVRVIPRNRLPCSAEGTPPIYLAMIRNSVPLVNTTNTSSIRVNEEGNYTCQATNKYGTDEREFVVIFEGEDTPIISLMLFLEIDKSTHMHHLAGQAFLLMLRMFISIHVQ